MRKYSQHFTQTIIQAICRILAEDYGINGAERNPWYFPSIGQYCSLLEQHGFYVTQAQHFDRPTRMEDGEEGLSHWLNSFGGAFFKEFDERNTQKIYSRVAEATREKLFDGGSWHVDYKRIRIIALKS